VCSSDLTVATAVGSRARIVHVPKALLLASARIVGRLIGDVVLTRDEIEGLSANLLVTSGVPTGTTKFSTWLTSNADGMGRKWASELARHFVA
jgi:NADH dehydrogenase